MTREQILAILYDMALASGSETHVRPLITKTLQRLLYHTTFPCGMYLVTAEEPGRDDLRRVRVEMAVGCHQLLPFINQNMALPAALLDGPSALIEEETLLAALPHSSFVSRAILRLRVSADELFLLLSPRIPETTLPLSTLFESVLRNFAKNLRLCRENEAATHSLQQENRLRQAAETQLRQERDLFVAGPAVVFRWAPDEEWHIRYASDNVAEQFGYPASQLLEEQPSFRAMIHPDDRQRVAELPERFSPSGREYYEAEYRLADAEGRWRWVFDITFPQRNAQGECLSLNGYIIDITARKDAELEQRLLASAFDAHEAITITDSQRNILRVNRAFTEITGYSEAEVVGRKPSLMSSGLHDDDFYRSMWREIERQGHWEGEIVNRRKGGELYSEWLSISALRDERGEISNYIAHFTDLSPIKERQQQIERAAAEERVLSELLRLALAESGKRTFLNATLETLLTGIPWLSVLPQGAIFLVDRQSPEELMLVADYHLPAEVARRCQRIAFGHCLCGRAAAQREVIASTHLDERHDELFPGMEDHGHYTLPITLGEELLGVLNLYLPAGHATVEEERAFLLRATDVLALGIGKRVGQRQLMQAKEEAEAANRAKSDFLSSMSHELRTPMNAILGFAQILEFDDALQAEQLDSVQEILKAGNHLLELINEVLDLAKIEAGRIDLSLEPVVVRELVDECFNLVQPLAAKRLVALNHALQGGGVVRADRVRLKQVMLNLLSNAVKYNRDGGNVTLSTVAQGEGMIQLRVSDTGQGIPTERLNELFQPFNRLDAEGGAVEGTGIGLTITRRLVELMGGTIGVESTPGVGSTFWLDLPQASVPQTLPQEQEARSSEALAPPPAAQKRVLYVEDNPVNLKLVSQLLGRLSHIHLFTAHTPQLGIELAQAHRPELILLDINMPGMDGYQVLQVLRSDERLKSVPVVAVTANAMPRDIERGRQAGFSDYITKPINARDFINTVNSYITAAE